MSNPLDFCQTKPLFKYLLNHLTRLDALHQVYDEWLRMPRPETDISAEFLDFVLAKLDASIELIDEHWLESVPQTGPLVIVANHPLGGLEGMLLSRLMLKIRPDLKVMTNELLLTFPEFKDLFIGVDILKSGQQQKNAKSLRLATRHLLKGGALLVFPAGIVSHLNLKTGQIQDPDWNPMIAKLVKLAKAPCLPLYVEARNPTYFYLTGYIHKLLRTSLLPRVMLARRGLQVPVHVRRPIDYHELANIKDDQARINYLRFCCTLAPSAQSGEEPPVATEVAVKADVCQRQVESKITELAPYEILRKGQFSVFSANYQQLGCVMEQLAIERERTFRRESEGSGRELDSDDFDLHFQHLVVWDRDRKQIAGGYRLAKVDQVVRDVGLKGLYSSTLFDYDHDFVRQLGKAIEVGRSFVTPDYQGHPRILDMLWRGIGQYVAQNPEYHVLFGGVSISRKYSSLAVNMLSDTFMYHYGADRSIRRKVRALYPVKIDNKPWSKAHLKAFSEMAVINKLVGRIDAGKSIPILIRHYLMLNGKFISFSVNKGFSDSVDGLIMVDLKDCPEKYVKRYLGSDGYAQCTRIWETESNAA